MASKLTVALTGLKHVGKSTIGRRVAQRLQIRFDDLDDLLVEEYRSEVSSDTNGLAVTPREIYRSSDDLFRRLEHRALVNYLAGVPYHEDSGGRSGILATGGGISDNEAAFALLNTSAKTIFLDELIDVLYHRIISNGVPSFLDAERPEEHFREIAERRRSAYLVAADHVIPTNGLTPTAVGDAIIQLIR